MHRRYRNHKAISNDNLGGKILPNIIITYEKNHKLDLETSEFLKEHNIPMVYINEEKYKNLEQNQEKEEQQANKTDEGR